MTAHATHTIQHARVRAHAGTPPSEAPRVRLRVANLLEQTDLRPPSLPPSAVLVVHAVAMPVPAEAARPEAVVARAAWGRRVREQLTGCYRSAVRPVRGRVPPGASAVVFADASEWLACAVLDAGRGRRVPRWWWPHALQRAVRSPAPRGAGAALAAVLSQEPPRIPALLDHLVRWGRAEEGMRALPPAEARAVLQTLTATFRLDAAGPKAPPPARSAEAVPSPADVSARAAAWVRRVIPEGLPPRLHAVQTELLLVALALHRAPSQVHTLELRAARREIQRIRPSGAVRPGAATGERTPAAAERTVPGFRGEAEPEAVYLPSGQTERRPTAAEPGARPVTVQETNRARARTPQGSPTPAESGWAEPTDASPRPRGERPLDAPPTPHPAAAAEGAGASPVAFQDGVETGLGGVLYLLNLLTSLDVRGAFESWRRGGDLGTWALLEIVARTLLGGEAADRADPIWRMLAMLDGRPADVPPGQAVWGEAGVVLPARWAMEVRDEPARWCWAARRGRLRLWSDSGIAVADVPRDDAPAAAQVRALLARLGIEPALLLRRPFGAAPRVAFDGVLAADVPEALRPWLGGVVPFLHHRLRHALGSEATLADVLRRPGRLYVTSSHVDLVQPLAAVSLAARRAGLDRDPGWLPEAGRVVLFHFEGSSDPLS